jgi:flavin-binding protein dodecin
MHGGYYISEKDTEAASQHSIARTTTTHERIFWIELISNTRGIYAKKIKQPWHVDQFQGSSVS